MSKVFAVSDTWFNRCIDDGDQSVVDINQNIIDGWNSVINNDDVVYVLGGFGIADLYNVVVRLNGEIHFLDNAFNSDERKFMDEMKECIDKTTDIVLKERVMFEGCQIKILEDLDAVLSYVPLADWPGKSTGTYCFHGMTNDMDIYEHNVSCTSKQWGFVPACIQNVKASIDSLGE